MNTLDTNVSICSISSTPFPMGGVKSKVLKVLKVSMYLKGLKGSDSYLPSDLRLAKQEDL